MPFVSHLKNSLTLVLCVLAGCTKQPASVCEPEGFGCDECQSDTLFRCEYDGVEATESSCDECQAQYSLLNELCAQGYTQGWEVVVEEMVCTDESPQE